MNQLGRNDHIDCYARRWYSPQYLKQVAERMSQIVMSERGLILSEPIL